MAAGAAALSSVVAASSVIPRGYASPYIFDLISLERLPVAAGGNVAGQATDLACAGCGAPHRCIGWSPPKRWEDKECWLVPELHPRSAEPGKLENPSRFSWTSTGNFQLPAPNRSKGPRSLFGWVGTLVEECQD